MGDGALFSSEVFHTALARSHYPGRPASIENVSVAGGAYRVLLIDGHPIDRVRGLQFFYEPLPPGSPRGRPVPFLVNTLRRTLEYPPGPGPGDLGMRAPTVRFDGFASFEAYLGSRGELHPRSTIGRMSRQRRKLEREHDAVFAFDDGGEPPLQALLRLKSAQARAMGWYDACASAPMQALLRELRQSGILRLDSLTIDGRIAAVEAILAWPGRSYFKLGAYDPAFGQHSPGALLTAAAIRQAFDSGVKECDLQLGFFDEKRAWATHVRLIGPVGRQPLQTRLRYGITRPLGRARARLAGRP